MIRESTSLWLLKNVTCCKQGHLRHICKCQKVKADSVCPWAFRYMVTEFLFFGWTSFPVCNILLSLWQLTAYEISFYPLLLTFPKLMWEDAFTLLFENEGKPSFTSKSWRKIGTDPPEDSCSQQLSGGWALSCLLSLSVFWTELNLQTVSLFGKFVFCFVF